MTFIYLTYYYLITHGYNMMHRRIIYINYQSILLKAKKQKCYFTF